MADTTTPASVHVGDVVTYRRRGRASRIEVTYVDDMVIFGRIPYASTYVAGGQYEGSYRGQQSCWLSEVEHVEPGKASA